MLAIEGKVVNDHITNFVTGLEMLFVAFFCLNLHYPIEASATLEFIQRLVNHQRYHHVKQIGRNGCFPNVIGCVDGTHVQLQTLVVNE